MPARSIRTRLVIPISFSLLFPLAAQASIPAQERQALIAFYNSTGGPNWLKKTNWLGPEGTEGTWEGIVVDNGHVISISLAGNGLKGTVPPEIADLPYLDTLNLTALIPPSSWGVPYGIKNQVSGIASEIGLLTRLRSLSLGGLNLQNPPAGLGNLLALEYLALDENQLTAVPASLGQLALLRTLILRNNQLTSLPLQIFGLSNLTTLDVSENQLASLPAEIGNLLKLVYLGIHSNKLTSLPPAIGKLAGLTELHLGGNPLTEIPAELGQLPNLATISFGLVNRLPTGLGALKNVQKMWVQPGLKELSAEVGDMINLRELTLRYNSLSSLPTTLARLTNLETLDLTDNSFNQIPPVIGQIPSLTYLSLDENPLTGPIPANLGNLTRLKELVLRDGDTDTLLTGPLPPELGNMESLEKLVLEGDFTGPIPAEFGNLSNLTVLGLYGQFSSIPPEIAKLQKLVGLDIRGNYNHIPVKKALFRSIPAEIGQMAGLTRLQLIGSPNVIPPELGNLTGLTILWLTAEAGTPIPEEIGNLKALLELRLNGGFGGEIPAELAGLANLQLLDLGGNQLTGQIPASMGDLSHLQNLILSSNLLEGQIPPEFGKLKAGVLDLSHNLLSGSIPAELAAGRLDLSHNRLEGNIPYQIVDKPNLSYMVFDVSSNRLSGILPKELGSLTSNWVRVDWSWNALVPGEGSVYGFIGAHHIGEFMGNQSFSPFDLAAVALGNTVRLSWSPIPYQADSGGYQVLYRQREDEPWSVYGMTNSKSANSFTVTGLETGRVYYFALRTVTYPHPNNLNTVMGEPGNVAWAATTGSAEAWFPLYPDGPTQYTGLAITNLAEGEMHSEVQALSAGGGQAGFERNPAPVTLASGWQQALLSSEIFGARTSAGPWSMHLSTDHTPAALCLQGGPAMLDGLAGLTGRHKTLFFPRAYQGAGVLDGQQAVTRITALNPGTEPILMRLRLVGPQVDTAANSVSRTIPPGGLVSETLTELFGLAQPVSEAYVEGQVLEGEGVAGVAVVTVGEDKSLFVVPGSPPSGFSQLSAAQVASGQGVSTSVRLINIDQVQRLVTLQLYRDAGESPRAVSVQIPAGGVIERDLGAMFQLSAPLSAGSLEVTTDGTGVVGDVLVYGPQASYASAVPLSSRGVRDAVCGYLANGLGVFTGIAIFNPGSAETDVTVEVFSREGVSIGKTTFKLGAKGRLARQTAELVPSSAGRVGGYVRVAATEPVVIQEMFAADSLDYMSTVEPVILR